MVLTFNDNEENLFQRIMSYVNIGTKCLAVVDTHKNILRFGELEINESKRIITKKNSEIELTFIEFEIILLLAQNAGTIFSKEQIYDIVWKEPYSGDYNIVMSHIRNIREKIEDNPSKPFYIQTVWGVGYRFNKNLSSGLQAKIQITAYLSSLMPNRYSQDTWKKSARATTS